MDEPTTPYQAALLGQTATIYHLHSVDEYRDIASRLATQASRSLSLLSRDLEPLVFNQPPFIEAVKQLALNTRIARIRILLQDNSLVRTQGHRLIDLAQRLTSTIEIRKPGRESVDIAETFLIADDCGYLHRQLADRYEAMVCFNDHLRTNQLEERFTEIWERGEPDIEMVRLHL